MIKRFGRKYKNLVFLDMLSIDRKAVKQTAELTSFQLNTLFLVAINDLALTVDWTEGLGVKQLWNQLLENKYAN